MKNNEMGKVRFYNHSKGFGFIERESGSDVFVQLNSELGISPQSLHEGQKVRFTLVKINGNELAQNIIIIDT